MTTFNNDSLKNELASEFIRRNDLVNRWGNIISSFLALRGLRVFVPMSVMGASGLAIDLALGNNMSNNGSALFNYDGLAPFCRYNGSSQYHSFADAASHDILGSEAYVDSNTQGLTIGMWVSPRDTGTAGRMFAKGTTTGNARSYSLARRLGATDVFSFVVSGNGTNTFIANDTIAYIAENWYFVVGRYTPSTEVKIYVGGKSGSQSFWRSATNTTSIPATLNNSATGLGIGAQADGTSFSFIWASMCFLCAQRLNDVDIFSIFEGTRTVYGI
jgi:hypothetical protein